MRRANNVLRRSSVKLKSLSSGNTDLQLIISQIKDVKASFKVFMDAQEVLAEDLYSWSQKLENTAIQNSFSYMLQLSALWTEVQKSFYESLRKYKDDFELILEGDKHVCQARKTADAQEEIEVKAKRELQKATKKKSLQEIEVERAKVNQAEKNKEVARMDFTEKLHENEAVRMIIVKRSAMKLGSAYHEMATKCSSLFHANHLIAQEIPDAHGKELHSLRFRVNVCKDHLKLAEEKIASYRNESFRYPNRIGPSITPSQPTRRNEDFDRRHSQPPTAPTPSMFSSMSSLAISNSTNVHPDLDNAQHNTNRTNENFPYQNLCDQSLPGAYSSGNNVLGTVTNTANTPAQCTSPPYNPYYELGSFSR